MKKAFVLCTSALVLFIVVGVILLVGQHGLVSRSSRPIRNTMAAAAAPSSSLQPSAPLCDDAFLLEQAGLVLDAIADRDYTALSKLVPPVRGVTFTPYSTVDPEFDLCFFPDQIADAESDSTVYGWGFTDGRGSRISMTMEEYFDRYVFDADFRDAPEVSIDQVKASGNALENVADVFSGCRFVEYYFPERDSRKGGLDWCALKLVFAPTEKNEWRLVGLIHSEWTI